jgi:hypothetical protein
VLRKLNWIGYGWWWKKLAKYSTSNLVHVVEPGYLVEKDFGIFYPL